MRGPVDGGVAVDDQRAVGFGDRQEGLADPDEVGFRLVGKGNTWADAGMDKGASASLMQRRAAVQEGDMTVRHRRQLTPS